MFGEGNESLSHTASSMVAIVDKHNEAVTLLLLAFPLHCRMIQQITKMSTMTNMMPMHTRSRSTSRSRCLALRRGMGVALDVVRGRVGVALGTMSV